MLATPMGRGRSISRSDLINARQRNTRLAHETAEATRPLDQYENRKKPGNDDTESNTTGQA